MALAQRGAHVVAVDGAANLIEHASQQVLPDRTTGSIEWVVGDMLDPSLGEFDYVVAMDSLIHYRPRDVEAAVQTLAFQARQGLLFTIAPSTPMLRLMHVSGLLFPKSDRAPDIQPITVGRLCRRLTPAMQDQRWRLLNSQRVANFFYTSHALGMGTTVNQTHELCDCLLAALRCAAPAIRGRSDQRAAAQAFVAAGVVSSIGGHGVGPSQRYLK